MIRRGGDPDRERTLRDIDEEVAFHLEGRVDELMAAGLPEEEARRRAREAFGDVDRLRSELAAIDVERARRGRRREVIGGFVRDVRVAARRLQRSPGYALVAVLTLALGIGASVATFTVVNAVLLRPLPYTDADRLVRLWPGQSWNITLSREAAMRLPSVEAVTGIAHWGLTLTGEGPATVLDAAVVDASYFDVFGVQPILGRAFTAAETEPARSAVVVLGYDTWRTRFGADPGVIGRRIQLSEYDHATRVVIGVMPPGHQTLEQVSDVWIPLHVPAGRTFLTDSSYYVTEVVARLSPGATVERISDEVRAMARQVRAEYPGRFDEESVETSSAVTLLNSLVGDVRDALWKLLAAVGLVLLIACGNLANLVLARTSGRRREIAVRAALGASRGRLIAQQLAESAILAVLGGVLGIALGMALLDLTRVTDASGLPRAATLALDGRVLLFALAVTFGSLLAFGLPPALRATRIGLRDDLASAGRGAGIARGALRLNRALVAAEIAMATVLTIAAALVLASFVRLRSVDPGMDVSDVVAIEILPPADRYTGERHVMYYDELLTRLRRLPGLTGLGAIHILPFSPRNWSFPYLGEGQTPRANQPLPSANFRLVAPGYFDAVDQPLLSGRDFTDADRANTPRVVIINGALANRIWPGADAVGRDLFLFGSDPYEVIGVVADARQQGLDLPAAPTMYVPIAQWTGGGSYMQLMLEAPNALQLVPAARSIIEEIDPAVPIINAGPLADALAGSLAQRRFIALVLVAFGGLALVLGGIGVYGVLSHLVGVRLPDFGLRMALGASPRAVQYDALRTGLLPAAAGLLAGMLTALATARLIGGLLFGIRPINLPTYAGVGAVLLAVATLASWLPARRAARADPLTVLHAE